MKKFLWLAPLILLAGCNTIGTLKDVATVATSPTPIGDVTVLDDKAITLVQVAYNVPAFAYVSADERQLLPAPLKATVKPILQFMNKLRLAALEAHRVGDLTTFNQRYKALVAFKGTVLDLIPR